MLSIVFCFVETMSYSTAMIVASSQDSTCPPVSSLLMILNEKGGSFTRFPCSLFPSLPKSRNPFQRLPFCHSFLNEPQTAERCSTCSRKTTSRTCSHMAEMLGDMYWCARELFQRWEVFEYMQINYTLETFNKYGSLLSSLYFTIYKCHSYPDFWSWTVLCTRLNRPLC